MATPNERLKQLRLELNLSQRAFGKLLGLLQGSYSDIERGKVNVSGTVLRKLEKLGYNSEYIEHGKGDVRRHSERGIEDRVDSVIKELGFNEDYTALAKKIDVNLDELSFLTSDGEPSPSFVESLLNAFPQINRKWLYEGAGTMFNTNSQESEFMKKEIALLRESLAEKSKTIEDKDKTISNLYRQIDLLQSFIPMEDK